MDELEFELRRAVEGEVRFDPYSRWLYSTDASHYQIEPIGLVIPRHTGDVQAVLEIAARHGAPILPRGGGSSLAGQAVGRALVLDFSKHMRNVLEINGEAHWARVQPGLVCDALDAALRPHGLMFGTEPASANRATMGGIIGNNATGAHSLMYGMTGDHLLAARGFLADAQPVNLAELDPAGLAGRLALGGPEAGLLRGVVDLVARCEPFIREHFPKTWRRASGYSLNYLLAADQTASRPAQWYLPGPYPPVRGFNLARVLAGSEGTLAVVTEATLNLVPRPPRTALSVVHFDSLAAAADATPAILDCGPSAVELIDRLLIDLTRSAPGFAPRLTFVEGRPAALLVVEFYGEGEGHLQAQLDRLEARLRAGGLAQTFVRAISPKAQADVWGVRKVGLGLLASMRGDAKPAAFMEDVAVPVERLGEWVRETERLFAEHGLEAGYYAHASAGCLHIRPILNLKTANGLAHMRALSAEVLEVVIRMGGAFSGEHGDGLARSAWNGRLFGPDLYQAFRDLKRLFDPQGRLNPGKIVDAPDPADNLRYGPGYVSGDLATTLSFAAEGGFAAAVEQCNGQGVCRKQDGSMCPSFQATREEEHSTRGRANALRAALSGRLPAAELTSARMRAVLDLCLECKACKAECPSGVDLAKIKYEFLDHYQAAHGAPLRSQLFAHIHDLSRAAQPLAALINPILSLGPVRWLTAKALGLAPRRPLPAFAPRTFRQWFRSRPGHPRGGDPVVLFVDTFTDFNQPQVGQAAVRVLERAGYDVMLVEHGCCGRPMISKGLLAEARGAAARVTAALAPWAAQGIPIIGLEPSCLLSLRDDYLDLLPGRTEARQAAGAAVLIEEFIAARVERFRPLLAGPGPGSDPEPAVLVHAHCYQKALTSAQALRTMLSLTGWRVDETEAGCCGLAGSFGYEAEHYAISMQVGEDRLLPAVRSAGPQVRLAASGISCRHQITHGTGRTAQHPIEVLASALSEA